MHRKAFRITDEILGWTFMALYTTVLFLTLCVYLPFRRKFFRKRLMQKVLNYFEKECSFTTPDGKTVYIAVDSLKPIDDNTIVQDMTISFRILDYPPKASDTIPSSTHVRIVLQPGTVVRGDTRCIYHFGCMNSFRSNIRGFKEFVLQSAARHDAPRRSKRSN